jgi:hypothetical protein
MCPAAGFGISDIHLSVLLLMASFAFPEFRVIYWYIDRCAIVGKQLCSLFCRPILHVRFLEYNLTENYRVTNI